MKRTTVLLSLLVSFLAVTFFAGNIYSAEKPIRILLIVGGHGYDKVPLHQMLKEMPGAQFREIELPKDQDMLKPGIEKDFDILVFHDQSQFKLSAEQKKNLEAMWTSGMPTVMLHHALIAHNDFPLFREVYGCAYLIKETKIDGRNYPASKYLKPADVNCLIVDQRHPITEGMTDFTLNDEVFNNLYLNPKINVLVRTDHPQSSAPLVWTWHYKKSPVFVIIPGDNGVAFRNANYRKLVYRGIHWAVDNLKR